MSWELLSLPMACSQVGFLYGHSSPSLYHIFFFRQPFLVLSQQLAPYTRKWVTYLPSTELDATFNAADRRAAEDILSAKTAQIFETRLFSNAPHAFAVRTNMSDPELRFAKEASFRQAVEWMNAFL